MERLGRWRKGLSSDHCGVQKPPFKTRRWGAGVGERLRKTHKKTEPRDRKMQGRMSEESERLCWWESRKKEKGRKRTQEGGVEYELKRQREGER